MAAGAGAGSGAGGKGGGEAANPELRAYINCHPLSDTGIPRTGSIMHLKVEYGSKNKSFVVIIP